jgi:methionine-rich copper-binding protein CopC
MTGRILAGLGLAAVAALGAAAPGEASVRHLQLDRSVPGADSVLAAAPTHVVLWFTQEPNVALSAITVKRADGTPVRLGPVATCPTDKQVIHAKMEEELPSGRYRVEWRTAGPDGHVIRGALAFRVR